MRTRVRSGRSNRGIFAIKDSIRSGIGQSDEGVSLRYTEVVCNRSRFTA